MASSSASSISPALLSSPTLPLTAAVASASPVTLLSRISTFISGKKSRIKLPLLISAICLYLFLARRYKENARRRRQVTFPTKREISAEEFSYLQQKWEYSSRVGSRRCVVIIGGCGFLGRNVVRGLAARGYEVRCFDVKPQADLAVAAEAAASDNSDIFESLQNVAFIKGDIRKLDDLRAAMKGAHTVVHTASMVNHRADYRLLYDINVNGTLNVIRACEESDTVVQLIYIGSSGAVNCGRSIIGGDESLPYSNSFIDSYSATKAYSEQEILAANGRRGVLTTVLRFHALFGPGARFMEMIANDESIVIGSGQNKIDIVYIDNAVHAIALACDKLKPGSRVAGNVYFITNQEPISVREFMQNIASELGQKPLREVPYVIAWTLANYFEILHTVFGKFLPFQVPLSRGALTLMTKTFCFSDAKAALDLNYGPIRSITEGIVETVRYYQERKQE